jgi:diacylglycerol kinase family enzyme
MSRRLAALIALVAFVLGLVLLVVNAIEWFPRGLAVGALLIGAVVLGWQGLLRRGPARVTLWVVAALALVAGVVGMVVNALQYGGLGAVLLLVIGTLASKAAFGARVALPPGPPPKRAVVVYNPKSGGGKAATFGLAEQARARGIEPIELKPGDDLVTLVRDAVARGADALAAAGGDGTQALVATIAAEYDLPFACIPAGTRNHFALDLGVDRDDVVGALDAFVNGGEKRVDLGLVSDRTFVNNVSLGLYAEAVQHEGYRGAKIRTLLDTASTVLSRDAGSTRELRWTGPDGSPQRQAAVILVSNNVYRLGRAIGSGTRPRLDAGRLGIAVMGAPEANDSRRRRPLRQWSATTFVVGCDSDVPVGVDGEALVMRPPVTFRVRPGALRVRIAPHHPGASPSAALPPCFRTGLRMVLRIVAGADPLSLMDGPTPAGTTSSVHRA